METKYCQSCKYFVSGVIVNQKECQNYELADVEAIANMKGQGGTMPKMGTQGNGLRFSL